MSCTRCRFLPFCIGRDGGKPLWRNRCAVCSTWEHPLDPDVIAFDEGRLAS